MVSHLTPFSANVSHENGHLLLELTGELDLATAPRLGEAINDLVRPHLPALTLDLAGLTFVDLAGLRTILDAKRKAGAIGARFRLQSVNNQTLRTIRLARFGELDDVVAVIEPVTPGRGPDVAARNPRCG